MPHNPKKDDQSAAVGGAYICLAINLGMNQCGVTKTIKSN